MDRPYIGHGIEALEALFKSAGKNAPALKKLKQELNHRTTKRAQKLQQLIEAVLSEVASSVQKQSTKPKQQQQPDEEREGSPRTNTEDPPNPRKQSKTKSNRGNGSESEYQSPNDLNRPERIAKIRPVGTKGLPDAYVRHLNDNLALKSSSSGEPLDLYVEAISALISEIKKTGAGQRRYELENGRRIDNAASSSIYAFVFVDEAELFEDAPIEVEVAGRRVDGNIVSISAGQLILSLSGDLGDRLSRAALLVNATALLEALKQRLTQVKAGEISLNRANANACVGKAPFPPKVPAINHGPPSADLNPSQQSAYQRALRDPILFLWGPPGCGKTKTLGEIVRAAFEAEKRVLICSTTNRAVDEVLYRVCSSLGLRHAAMEEGRVVRLGRITDVKLQNEFAAYVTVDGIVERRSKTLRDRKIKIENEISRIDASSEAARRTIARFDAHDVISRELDAAEKRTNESARNGKAALQRVRDADQKLERLKTELHERKSATFTLFKRSEEAIQRDILSTEQERAATVDRAAVLKRQYEEERTKFEEVKRKHDRSLENLRGLDKAAAERAINNANAAREPLVAELREIEAKVADLSASIIKDAKVLGATCTKAYLSVKDLGQFDLVIVDEASMVMLPIVWFAAGLSRERVLICGDFRQIPPIVQTREQAIFDAIGRDVFEATGLTKSPEDDLRLAFLDTQYRMQRPICDLIAKPMYRGNLRTATIEGREEIKPPDLFRNPLTIVDTADLWPFESTNAFGSRFNLMHALLSRNLAWHLQQEGYLQNDRQFGICTPYAAQARLTQKLLQGDGLNTRVQAGTVHRYQGDERRMMLLDVPESHGGRAFVGQFIQGLPPSHVGARLINVAVSRAQDHLVILANLTHLDKHLPSTSLLRGILFEMQECGRVVPGRALLKLRPIERDLGDLFNMPELDIQAREFGLFDQHTFDPAFRADVARAKTSIVVFSGFITPNRTASYGDLFRAKILRVPKLDA